MTPFLALWWPELTGFALIVAATWWTWWALNGDLLDTALLAVPFGCGVGMGVAEVERRRRR